MSTANFGFLGMWDGFGFVLYDRLMGILVSFQRFHFFKTISGNDLGFT